MHSDRKDKHYYKAFGLTIASDFPISEMLAAEENLADVTVSFGSVPRELTVKEKQGVRFQLNDTEFLLHVDGIADYYVKDGKEIYVHKDESSTCQEMRLFLLSSVFSGLLYLRGNISLHASAIKSGKECFVVCGNSGAGKSTLTHEFINAGYQVLSDDVSVLKEAENIQIQPSFPFIKLWKDSLDHLDISETDGFKLREQLSKYGFRLDKEYFYDSLPVKKVFILLPHNKPEYEVEELTGIEKFNALKNNTYRYQFVSNKVKPVHFDLLNKLAKQAQVYRIRRPQTPIDTENLRKKIEGLLNS